MLKRIISWVKRFFLKKLDNPKHNRLIEEHAGLLKKPPKGTSLYKIVSSHCFYDMIKNDYLYFNRVDTYSDDNRDSDLPDRDKEIGKKNKFISDPNSSIVDYYEICRSKTYACCFSTENTEYIWDHYGDDNQYSLCLVFDCYKLINFLNDYFNSEIRFLDKPVNHRALINHGLVTYGDFDKGILRDGKPLPNPWEYIYFKDKEKYSEEREFRVSVSFYEGFERHLFLGDGSTASFPKSMYFGFPFRKGVELGVIKKILISEKCPDKRGVKIELKKLLSEKGMEALFK